MKNSKNLSLLLALILSIFFSSCGQRAELSQAKFSLHFDTDTLISSSSTNPSNRPTDPLYVAGKGRLEFFGIVVRDLGPSTVTKDAAGTPVGLIIPPASLMLTSWTNRTQLINILTSGTAEVNVTIPLGRNLSVTTYLVFIEDDTNMKGPGTLTTIFNVSPAINIAQSNQQVVLNVDTSVILDDAKPFVDWYGAFSDATGNVLVNTDVFLRHCKIGFEFSQTMFGASPDEEEKNFFRTNDRGWIHSVGISGVDFEIRAGNQIVKPCGQPSLEKNYPNATPQVAFTGFKGATRYNDPALFNTALPVVAQNLVFNSATNTMINNVADDPDGDGLSTSIELEKSLSNPFVKNFFIQKAFDYDTAGMSGPFKESTELAFYFKMASGFSCASASVTVYPMLGSDPVNYSPSITQVSSNATEVHCKASGAVSFVAAPATDGHYNYWVEIDTPMTSLTSANGRTIPIVLYKQFVLSQGTMTNGETLTTPTLSYIYKNRDNDIVSNFNPNAVLPILDSSVDAEYMIKVAAADLIPGGFFFYATDASCSAVNNNKVVSADFEFPGVSILHLDHRENFPSTLYLCHKKSFSSTSTKFLGSIGLTIDSTKTYATVAAQASSVAHNSPYSADAVVYDTANNRAITCGLANLMADISVTSGTTNVQVSNVGNIAANQVANPFAFIHPVSGLPTCAYFDAVTNDRILLLSVDATNTGTELSSLNLSSTSTPGAAYTFRSPKLMVLSYDASSQPEVRVFDLSSSNAIVASASGIFPGTIQMLAGSINSSFNYFVSLYDAGQIKTYSWNGSTFALLSSNNFAPGITPMIVKSATDDLGNTFVVSGGNPGATVYKFNGTATGTVIFNDSVKLLPTGKSWFATTKNRLTYTDGAKAQYLDQANGTWVNLMGDYLFQSVPQETSAASFMDDNLFFSYYSSSFLKQTIVNMTVK